jgi:hypothetical protein
MKAFVCAVVLGLFVLILAAAPSSASVVDELIDPAVVHANPEELPHVSLDDSGSALDDLHVDTDALTGLDKRLVDTSPEESQDELDWCLWSGTSQMATEMAGGEPPSEVGNELEAHLLDCLKSHFEGTAEASSVGWVAKALTVRNEIATLEALGYSNVQAWNQLTQHGVTLSAEEWAHWFQEFAAAVPPA